MSGPQASGRHCPREEGLGFEPRKVNINPFALGGSYGDCISRLSTQSIINVAAGGDAVASIVCGDFNMDAGTPGYLRMTGALGGDRYVDAVWQANPEGFTDRFHRLGDPLEPRTAQRYFLGDGLGGQVSDHLGVIVRLRLAE